MNLFSIQPVILWERWAELFAWSNNSVDTERNIARDIISACGLSGDSDFHLYASLIGLGVLLLSLLRFAIPRQTLSMENILHIAWLSISGFCLIFIALNMHFYALIEGNLSFVTIDLIGIIKLLGFVVCTICYIYVLFLHNNIFNQIFCYPDQPQKIYCPIAYIPFLIIFFLFGLLDKFAALYVGYGIIFAFCLSQPIVFVVTASRHNQNIFYSFLHGLVVAISIWGITLPLVYSMGKIITFIMIIGLIVLVIKMWAHDGMVYTSSPSGGDVSEDTSHPHVSIGDTKIYKEYGFDGETYYKDQYGHEYQHGWSGWVEK